MTQNTLSFKELVEVDLRNGTTKTQRDTLHSDIEVWHDCLKALKRDVEVQFSLKRAEILKRYASMVDGSLSEAEYNHEYADADYRKVGSLRFLQAIETRLSYVKAIKREAHTHTSAPVVTTLNEKSSASAAA